jgi:hypothetical protein
MTKYRAQPVVIDGIRFASKAEARRYGQLKLLEKAGEISGLQLQPKFPIVVNGVKVCAYIADFAYFTATGRVVEDVKGVQTPMFRLKRKLVEAIYPGVQIAVRPA